MRELMDKPLVDDAIDAHFDCGGARLSSGCLRAVGERSGGHSRGAVASEDTAMANPLPENRPGGAERPRVLIIGAGFAGFHCARALDRRLGATADLVLVNPVDHMVYTALLPDVVGGLLDPRGIATPLAASLPFTKVLVGTVTAIDTGAHTCAVRGIDGREELLTWDRLVLNPGSVTRTMGVAGVLEHAHGFKTLAEALYLRERILRQLQFASATTDSTLASVTARSWWSAVGSQAWNWLRKAASFPARRCASTARSTPNRCDGPCWRLDRACWGNSRPISPAARWTASANAGSTYASAPRSPRSRPTG